MTTGQPRPWDGGPEPSEPRSPPGGGAEPGETAVRHRLRDLEPSDVDAELASHFAGTVHLLMSRGWSEEDARAEALRRFGDVARYRSELERIRRRRQVRKRARYAWEVVQGSAASALRGARRSPAFSAAVIVTLALGIGANAAIFQVVDRLLLSPPPGIRDPSDVRILYQTMANAEDGETYAVRSFTYPDVRALRSSGLPVRVGVVQFGQIQILGEGAGAAEVVAARVDSAFFPLLGVTAAHGRSFVSDDHRAGAPPVALLGHALWASRFGSDPAVLGRAIRVGDGTYQVAGVLPPGFIGAMAPAVDVWIPLEATAEQVWDPGWENDQRLIAFHVLARMNGFDLERFTAEAAEVLRRARVDYALRGELLEVGGASLIPADGPDNAFGTTVPVSRWLAAVSLLVLLVACANVANLFLAQGARLTHETSVRMALGAGRLRVAGEVLARSLLLALLGAAGAFAVAALGGSALERLVFGSLRFTAELRATRLIAFTTITAVVAATLSGVIPALRASRQDLRPGLHRSGRSLTGRSGPRRALIALQTALSALLLVGATLFVTSFRAATGKDLGFDIDRLVRVRLVPHENGVDLAGIYEAAESAVRAIPGIAGAARSVAVPFERQYGLAGQLPAGEVPEGSARAEIFAVNAVGTAYFETMGIRLLRGRPIEARDLASGAEPVVVVSRSAAELLWPGAEALGRCLAVGSGERQVPCVRVVGVAEDHAQQDLADDRPVTAWVPLTFPAVRVDPVLMVRAERNPESVLSAVRERAFSLPGVRYAEVTPMRDVAGRIFRSWKLGAAVFSLFAVIALAVAGMGVYGLLSYEVAQRRREIGIRVALGATGSAVLRFILGGALATVAAGLGVGLAVSVLGARRLESLLYEVSAREPAVFVLAAMALVGVAIVASALPAWRAARVDPRESLSAE